MWRGGAQAAAGEGRVRAVEHLVAERERGAVAARQVGADRRSRRPRPEHRAVADVPVQRVGAPIRVVVLGQAPDVVVADRVVIPRADAHLVVEGARAVVPHPQQPLGPEAHLARRSSRRPRRRPSAREVADAGRQDRLGVAGRVQELEVVAGVPPAARRVDALAQRCQVSLEDPVAIDLGRQVRHRVLVVQVPGRSAQRRGHVVGSVALHLVETARVRDRRRVDRRAAADPKRRRGCGDRAADRDRVRARSVQRREVDRANARIGVAPRARGGADLARQHRAAGGVDDVEHRARAVGAGHQERSLGRAQRVAELVDADERAAGGGTGRRCGYDDGEQRTHHR